MSAIRTGVVASFDDPRGIGVITDAEGVEYPFHCTAIADGTRRIDVGVAVHFVAVAGHQGRWEASAITPI
ncbi:MAG: cold shock domain-containing protein [Acidimicrobiales bacterium]